MSDSWLDGIPSHEREKIRRRLRSPEEYEKLRDKVKGPEDLEKEMEKNEAMAELRFALETEPAIHDALKTKIESDIREQGIENIVEKLDAVDAQKQIEQGKFRVTVSAHPTSHHDQLSVMPEGTVQEKIPLKTQISDQYIGQFQKRL